MTLEQFKAAVIANVKANYSANVIGAVYPIYMQLNIIRAGGQNLTDMSAFIDGKRADVDMIEAEISALQNTSVLDSFTPAGDTADSAYVATAFPALTKDEQKLYVACALRRLK